MEEIWKSIPGFNDYYASNLGRIKSLRSGKEKIIGSQHLKKNGYIRSIVSLNGVTYTVGRIILMTFYRFPNNNEECDHIDRNSTNNRIENLRWVSRSENLLNRRNYGNSNLKGVSYCKTKYKTKDGLIKFSGVFRSQITINKLRINLGNYKTEEAAHESYKNAYFKYYGHEWMD